MPDGSAVNDILVAPMDGLIRQVCSAVGAAQLALDSAALASQAALAADHPTLAAAGYQVTWYHMPEVSVELKLAVHVEDSPPAQATHPGKRPRLLATPFNAKYQNAFQYKADGSSVLRFRVVPIPPPVSVAARPAPSP
ncbi:MAG: hypothetical protein U0572_02435 [Phycisphaerales bacterium]